MNGDYKNVLIAALLVSLGTIAILPALAADPRGLGNSFDEVDTIRGNAAVRDIGNIADFIVDVLRVFLAVVVVIAVGMVIWGGFLYITSAGDEDKARQGKKTILYAIIGLVLIGLAALIVNFIVVLFME